MYDLHNHLLPGVDDGARNLKVTLRMLEMALRQGITHVACTPHATDRLDARQDRLFQSVFLLVKIAAKEHGLPIDLTLASEMMVGTDLLKVLAQPTATFAGEGKYALVKFYTEMPFDIMQNVVIAMMRHKVRPVVAHYKRYARAQSKPEQPRALRDLGAILTLDAGSLVGQFGNNAQRRAKQLIGWNVVDILASDAHDDEDHGFKMKEGLAAATALAGEAAARRMVLDHPRLVWEGLPWPVGNSAEENARS